MIYSFDLQSVGFALGLLLIAAHLVAVLQPAGAQKWLKSFPRSRAAGTVLLAAAAIWSFILIRTMDLGEFAGLRNVMTLGIIAGAVLAWLYVEEFLAVRALGMLALLAAEPLLGAAFLRPEYSKLLVVILAYAWILLGLFWVGMPWLLRDQIAWLTSQKARFQAAAWGGVIYGAVVLGCAALLWK